MARHKRVADMTEEERESQRAKDRDRKREQRARVKLAKEHGLDKAPPPVDYDRIEAVVRLAPTASDGKIAAALGMTPRAWKMLMDTDPDAVMATENGRATIERIVFAAILRKIRLGDTRMIIHASKFVLNWKDHVEHTGKDGGTIKSEGKPSGGLTVDAVREFKAQVLGIIVEPEESEDAANGGKATG